jgi:hypothetical protein
VNAEAEVWMGGMEGRLQVQRTLEDEHRLLTFCWVGRRAGNLLALGADSPDWLYASTGSPLALVDEDGFSVSSLPASENKCNPENGRRE